MKAKTLILTTEPTSMSFLITRKNIILFSFIAVKFILQYSLINAEYDLHRDEYLHLDQAHHLAWGFLSVPPLTSWISHLIYLLGNTVFWVKFFPALLGALTIYIVWKAIEELKGTLFALILGSTCVLFSIILRINTLYQPNSFDILSWTTFYFVLIKYFNTTKPKWLFVAAIVFGLGFLNKYNIVFLFMGLTPALLLTQQRKIFIHRRTYFAALLGILIIAPNLLWQYKNNFPVISHLNELAENQLVNIERVDFLRSQLLFFIGSLFVILISFYAFWRYKPFKNYRTFFWSFLFTLLVFLYFKAKDYYAIGLYPIYIVFGSVYLADLIKSGWKKNLQPLAIALPIITFIPFYNIAFPNQSPEYIVTNQEKYIKYGLLRWEDGKDHSLPQDFADMLGWKELATMVDSIYGKLSRSQHTLVLCDNYGQAGAINYYSSNKEIVALAGRRINTFAREDTISIFVLKGAKVNVNNRLREEANRKKNY